MTRQETISREEAVRTISRISGGSVSYAEDLYDSFFPKPVVKQCVADWYEGNKRNLDLNLCSLVFGLAMNSTDFYREELKAWAEDNKKTFITTIVNMHQFGYTVESEPRYTVKVKGIIGYVAYLNQNLNNQEWFFASNEKFKSFRVAHTRKELEDSDFGWVFDCPGVEVKEVE
ncbi:DUF1642 domain-containing protein [Streptococcus salivarius]